MTAFFLSIAIAFAGLTELNVRELLAGPVCLEVEPDTYTYSQRCLDEVHVSHESSGACPMTTFRETGKGLENFFSARCMDACSRWRATKMSTGEVFSIWQTNEDDCDGGNSHGILVEGKVAVPSKVIRLIWDSDLYGKEEAR